MAHNPQKPLTKKKATTVRWTKDADNRLSKIEKQLEIIEQKLEKLINKRLTETESVSSSKVVYSLRKKS
jgi:fructose-1,6-bisphosphatase